MKDDDLQLLADTEFQKQEEYFKGLENFLQFPTKEQVEEEQRKAEELARKLQEWWIGL